MLLNGSLISDIRLRAAKKLIGMAIKVPKVVASKAMKTVSTILSQVTLLSLEIIGAPTFTLPVTESPGLPLLWSGWVS